MNKWLETKNPEYKQLAQDELRHSEVFIKQALQAGMPREEMQEISLLHDSITSRLANK
jgi:hypothetical protein